MWTTEEEKEQWADDHGYYRWTCRKCGMSGWTDTRPECACPPEPEETDPEEEAGSND